MTHPVQQDSQATAPVHAASGSRRRPRLPRLRMSTINVLVATCVVCVLSLVSLSGFLLWQNAKLKRDAKQSDSTSQQNIVSHTIAAVGKLYALPKNERPTVATIKDVSQLKSEPFFDSAKNGDRVLVYTKAKIAILYRDSENKIINIGPVAADQSSQSSTSQNATTTEPNQ